jgi:hypothetical protein
MSAIKKEIAKIHVLKKLYQLTEEELYLHVKNETNSDSISKLTKPQAWKVIKTLEAKYNPQKPKPRRYTTIRSNSNVIALMTPDQREYLEDLIGKINASTKYKMSLEGMAQRQFKKSEKLLTRNEARILTEAAKSILTRNTKPVGAE